MEGIVLFDAYGTLFDLDLDHPSLNEELGEEQEPFLLEWRSKLLEYTWLVGLSEKWEPFESLIHKALLFICEKYSKSSDKIRPILLDIYKRPVLFGDAEQALNLEKVIPCILSNGDRKTLEDAVRLNKIDHLIHRIFSASDVQSFKVSPKVYEMGTKAFDLLPDQVYFVSSNPWDISGAGIFGFKTIWVNRSGKVFDRLIERPTYEINSLAELANLQ